MKLSVKSDYATRAILGLSRHYPSGESRRVEDLAKDQGVPAKFLAQILIELKARHIVKSFRGKQGGYQLTRPPAEISMADVIKSVEGEMFEPPAIGDGQCPPALREAWKRLQSSLEYTAANINFQQILESNSEKEKMYYI